MTVERCHRVWQHNDLNVTNELTQCGGGGLGVWVFGVELGLHECIFLYLLEGNLIYGWDMVESSLNDDLYKLYTLIVCQGFTASGVVRS